MADVDRLSADGIGVWVDGQARPYLGQCIGQWMGWCKGQCKGPWVHGSKYGWMIPSAPNLATSAIHYSAAQLQV